MAPRPFVLGVVAVYLTSFLSQFLLAAPVIALASVVPFLLVQAGVAWFWYALHARRLRDAGRPHGAAVALTVLYGLGIVLLLLVTVAVSAQTNEAPLGAVFQVFLLLFLIGSVTSDPNLGMFGVIILGMLVLVMLPILIAVGFTVWAATRPRLTPPP